MKISIVRIAESKVPAEALRGEVQLACVNFPKRVSKYVYYLGGSDRSVTKTDDRESPLALLHIQQRKADPVEAVQLLLGDVERLVTESHKDADAYGGLVAADSCVLVLSDPAASGDGFSLFANVFLMRGGLLP